MEEHDKALSFIRFKGQDDAQTLTGWFDSRDTIEKVSKLYVREPKDREFNHHTLPSEP